MYLEMLRVLIKQETATSTKIIEGKAERIVPYYNFSYKKPTWSKPFNRESIFKFEGEILNLEGNGGKWNLCLLFMFPYPTYYLPTPYPPLWSSSEK